MVVTDILQESVHFYLQLACLVTINALIWFFFNTIRLPFVWTQVILEQEGLLIGWWDCVFYGFSLGILCSLLLVCDACLLRLCEVLDNWLCFVFLYYLFHPSETEVFISQNRGFDGDFVAVSILPKVCPLTGSFPRLSNPNVVEVPFWWWTHLIKMKVKE